MEYLVLPGYGGSGPQHWQSLWEAAGASSPLGGARPRFRRVEQADWNRPAADRWARGFAPVPRTRLPFRSTLVASSDDPYATLGYLRELAADWGAEFVSIGARGHINADSGLGSWPEGRARLEALAAG